MSTLQLVDGSRVIETCSPVPVPVLELADKPKARRGTTNRNDRGNTTDRERRRRWLVETYRADVHVLRVTWPDGGTQLLFPADPTWERIWLDAYENAEPLPTCRCYRCGGLLTEEDVTVDRVVPGCKGGTYRRNNIRPACGDCNSETGGKLGSQRRAATS